MTVLYPVILNLNLFYNFSLSLWISGRSIQFLCYFGELSHNVLPLVVFMIAELGQYFDVF